MMTAPASQCQSCRHWDAKPNAARGVCVLGEIDYPWCYNGCTRHLPLVGTQPSAPPHFDMRAAWGQYMPGVKKP
jgi:hypothetical protein